MTECGREGKNTFTAPHLGSSGTETAQDRSTGHMISALEADVQPPTSCTPPPPQPQLSPWCCSFSGGATVMVAVVWELCIYGCGVKRLFSFFFFQSQKTRKRSFCGYLRRRKSEPDQGEPTATEKKAAGRRGERFNCRSCCPSSPLAPLW